MSRRPACSTPLLCCGWRNIGDVLRELAFRLGLRLPSSLSADHMTKVVAPNDAFEVPGLMLPPSRQEVAIAVLCDNRRRYRIAARFFRRALRLLPPDPGPFQHARAGAELKRLQHQATDWAAWLEEAERESERLERHAGAE